MTEIAYFSNQFADRQGHGLARYARELYAALVALQKGVNVTPVAAWSSLDAHDLQALQRQTGLRLSPLGKRLTPIVWTFLDYPPIERMLDVPVDVVHAVALGYPVATRKPYMVTIHDLGPLTHPEFFTNTRPWIMQRSLAQVVRQADVIVCVSESTANEVVGYVGGKIAGRIRVVYEGVADSFFQPAQRLDSISLAGLPVVDTPFILATGKISPRKNIQGLLAAMSRLRDVIPHHLLLVGGDGWGMGRMFDYLADRGLQNRVHRVGYVSDAQLRALYAAASVYVHPSLYEGFGLTVLEAMAAGCPVVTSRVYSLPEVAGDAALLVDPENVGEMADAIESLCHDGALAAEYRSKGKERAAMFRWQSTAQQIAHLYGSMA